MVQITVAFAPPIILMIEINFGRGFPLLPQLEKVNVSLCGSVYIHLIGTNFLLHVCTFRYFLHIYIPFRAAFFFGFSNSICGIFSQSTFSCDSYKS